MFAADLPHGLKHYNEIFPPEDSAEAEYGPIEERVPQNEQELHELMNEMRRAGADFAD